MVEIETPAKKLFTSKNGQPYERAGLSQAASQIKNWLRLINEDRDAARRHCLPDLTSVHGILVIGRRADLTPVERAYLVQDQQTRRDIAIQTFDDLLDHANALLTTLESLTKL